jgi:para-nitrobenzyl esterase
MAFKRAAALLALAGAARADYACAGYGNSSVTTPSGVVNGFQCESFRAYLGVPYGSAARWEHSTVVAPWTTPVDATHDPVGCPQVCTEDEPPHICPARQSEDCLFLNIFGPAAPHATPVPVVIFLHGGNFHDGYAGGYEVDGGLLYDGQRYVNATGQLLVVINYRLGVGAAKTCLLPPTPLTLQSSPHDSASAPDWARSASSTWAAIRAAPSRATSACRTR